MSIRPFVFAEFENKTAVLKTAVKTRQPNGGYSQTTAIEATFAVSLQPRSGGRTSESGSPVIESTNVAYTSQVGLSLNNGDILTVDGVNYEIDNFETIEAFVGGYTAIYLSLTRE